MANLLSLYAQMASPTLRDAVLKLKAKADEQDAIDALEAQSEKDKLERERREQARALEAAEGQPMFTKPKQGRPWMGQRAEDMHTALNRGSLTGMISPGQQALADAHYRKGLRTGDFKDYYHFVGSQDMHGILGGADAGLGLILGAGMRGAARSAPKFMADQAGHSVHPARLLKLPDLRDVAREAISADVDPALANIIRKRAASGEFGEYMRQSAMVTNDAGLMSDLEDLSTFYRQNADVAGDRNVLHQWDVQKFYDDTPAVSPAQRTRDVTGGVRFTRDSGPLTDRPLEALRQPPRPRYAVDPEPLTPRQGTTADPEPFDAQQRLLGTHVGPEADTVSAGRIQDVKEELDRRLLERDPGSDAAFRDFDYEADKHGMLFSDYQENLSLAEKQANARLAVLRQLPRHELTDEEIELLALADKNKKSRAQLAAEHQAYQAYQNKLAQKRSREATEYLESGQHGMGPVKRGAWGLGPDVVTPAPGGAVREVYSADPTREQTERITDLLLRRGQYEGEARPIERFASSNQAQALEAKLAKDAALDQRMPTPKLPEPDAPTTPPVTPDDPNWRPLADPKEEFGKNVGKYWRYRKEGHQNPAAGLPPMTREQARADLDRTFAGLTDDRPFIVGTTNEEVLSWIPRFVEDGSASSKVHRALVGKEDATKIVKASASSWAPATGKKLSAKEHAKLSREVIETPYPRHGTQAEQDAWLGKMAQLLRDPTVRPPPVINGKYVIFYGHKNLPAEYVSRGPGRGRALDKPERVAHALGTRQMEWLTRAVTKDVRAALKSGVIKTREDFDNYIVAYLGDLQSKIQFWNPQQLHNYRVASQRLANAKLKGKTTVGPEYYQRIPPKFGELGNFTGVGPKRYGMRPGVPHGTSELRPGQQYTGVTDRSLSTYDKIDRELANRGMRGHGPSSEDLSFTGQPREGIRNVYYDKDRPFEHPTRVSPVREEGNRVIKSWLLQGPSATGRQIDRPRLYGYDVKPGTGKYYRGKPYTFAERPLKPANVQRKDYDPRVEWVDLEYDVIKIKNQINDHKKAQLTQVQNILVDNFRGKLPSRPPKPRDYSVDVTDTRRVEPEFDPSKPWPKGEPKDFELRPGIPLTKVISGGQTGADQAGIRVAEAYGIRTGGRAPKGYKTATGPEPGLRRLGLTEDVSTDYMKRTEQNVIDSDATVIFGNPYSTGSKYTISMAKRHKKPVIVVDWRGKGYPTVNSSTFRKWLIDNDVKTLNFAGNREQVNKGVHKKAAVWFRDVIAQKTPEAKERAKLAKAKDKK